MVFFCWLICSVFLLLPISRETLMFEKKTFIHSLTLPKYPINVLSRFPPVRCFQLATCCLGVVGGTDRCHIFLSISDLATSFSTSSPVAAAGLPSGQHPLSPAHHATTGEKIFQHLHLRTFLCNAPTYTVSVLLSTVLLSIFATLLTSILKEHIQF